MRTGLLVLAGVVAPLIYAAAVILGGWLTPGYSHLAQPVSALIMARAPAATVLQPLFTLYNALLIAFAFALAGALRGHGRVLTLLVPALLVLIGLAGILMLVYPMERPGAPLTYFGKVHLWLAATISVASLLAVLFCGLALRRDPLWRRFSGYSLISFIVMFFAAAFAGLAAARLSGVMGLWERLTVAAFLQWVFVLALVLGFRRPPAR